MPWREIPISPGSFCVCELRAAEMVFLQSRRMGGFEVSDLPVGLLLVHAADNDVLFANLQLRVLGPATGCTDRGGSLGFACEAKDRECAVAWQSFQNRRLFRGVRLFPGPFRLGLRLR